MRCKRSFAGLAAMIFCLALLHVSALAAPAGEDDAREAEMLDAIAAEQAAEEGSRAPLLSPLCGGIGLGVLFVFGALASRRRADAEELGCEPLDEAHCIGDPYRRLAAYSARRG